MRCLVLLIIVLCVSGCDFSQRTVIGGYRLERFESGKFYLEKAGAPETGGGCIDGTVEEIAWTNGLIFAKRFSTYRGDPDGWMIINVQNHSMVGPLAETEFRQRYPGVRTLSPKDAWESLK